MKLVVVTLLLTLTNLLAQVNVIDVTMQVNKRTYLCFEHVHGVVTLKNNGARDIHLHNENGNWLDFDILCNGSKHVLMAKNFLFQDCIIPAGKQVARKVVLTQLYPLTTPGNYIIKALVKPPGDNAVISKSAPAFFDVFNGLDVYRRQHGVKNNARQVVEYRIKKMNTPKGTELYFQSYDPKREEVRVTYSIGRYTGLQKIQNMVDGEGYLHTLFPIDAKLYRYLNISDGGKILDQKVVKQTARGIPTLAKLQDGRVGVRNGLHFDPQKEAEKKRSIHNISQRPPFSYK